MSAARQDAWIRTPWNPAEKPYRVAHVQRTSAPGMHGWRCDSWTFATIEEANAKADSIKVSRYVTVEVAENAATWDKNGKWRQLRRIKRAGRAAIAEATS